MPKYRNIYCKITESFDFAEMPNDFVRVFWVMLIVIVDSEGRGIDNVSWLRSKMFPLRDDVAPDQIKEAMEWLDTRGMIIRYQVDGKGYFTLTNFVGYQSGLNKEAPSVLPGIPEELQTNSGGTPEELQTKVASNTKTNTNTKTDAGDVAAVYQTYEREIGALTGTISDRLDYLCKEYPIDWIPAAFKESALNNARNLRYAEAILKRWKTDGFQVKKNNNGHSNGIMAQLEALKD